MSHEPTQADDGLDGLDDGHPVPRFVVIARALDEYPGTSCAEVRTHWVDDHEPPAEYLAGIRDFAESAYRKAFGLDHGRSAVVFLPYSDDDEAR